MRTQVLVCLLLLFPFTGLRAGEQEISWLHFSPLSSNLASEFEKELLSQIRNSGLLPERDSKSVPDFKEQLEALQQKKKQTIFLQLSLEEYKRVSRLPEVRALFRELGLELLNAELIGVPFYLLSHEDGVAQRDSRSTLLEIAFLTLNIDQIHKIEEADLLTMLSLILKRPKNTIKLYRERQAYTAAKHLYDGTYDLVAFYEDEPGILQDEFQLNLTQELKAGAAKVLGLADPENQIQEIAMDRLSYVSYFSSYSNSKSVAIVQESLRNLPVILSNLKHTRPETVLQVQNALSNAYFMMIPRISVPEETRKQALQGAFLWNAYLNDSTNRWKALAFLGHLLLMKDLKWKERNVGDVYEQKSFLFQKHIGLHRLSAPILFHWLGIQLPELEKREQFTDDVSGLYERALNKINDARTAPKARRIKMLTEARSTLIAALLQAEEPKNIKGTRGLWSVSDYNPYYQLARVALFLEKEKN